MLRGQRAYIPAGGFFDFLERIDKVTIIGNLFVALQGTRKKQRIGDLGDEL